MLKAFLRILGTLPLPLIHGLGILAGWTMYVSDHKFRRRIRNNLLKADITDTPSSHRHLVGKVTRETGKGLLETFAIWFRPPHKVLKWVRHTTGWEHVEKAHTEKKGIIFLTPHLGCYEITALYYAAQYPITVLFRPPRQQWLAPLIDEGRSRSRVKLAPTNMQGVRSLLRALKKGEAIGILPDQVPASGEGVWADFFQHPAYTMTLATKLAESTDATVLLAFGERLSWGRGFAIHIRPLGKAATPQHINDGIEQLVRQCPSQYLWSYRRFKKP